ncbi:hypothetical protein BWQ96_01703 [Gracilariopsis chorda]|uniref:U3 small nucleolar RNA-associated protein 4 n=1 Tax=Gracilariopsis chorda TaxID=448386 RepID=A0A2V3J2B4_9FLOR|nr:hypothetical protein BWQ96_01703 [Gracilariopsis chorda]|eukprot:PXF48534.1 hypothetical protein BWQ96_01703 [Gracilariopsis chorda]
MATSTSVQSQAKKRMRSQQDAHTMKRKRARHVESGSVAPIPLKVHECRFFQSGSRGVSSMSVSPSGRFIVIARTDQSIELKDSRAMWTTISIFFPEPTLKQAPITTVEFSTCNSYVFASRANGTIQILKVTDDGLVHQVSLSPGGGRIHDLSVCRDPSIEGFCIAAACQDGRVRIIRPDPSFFALKDDRDLPTNPAFYDTLASEKAMAPVTCLSWAPYSASGTDDCIVAGDADGGVRWMNPTNGSCYGAGKIPSLRGKKVVMKTIQFARGGRQVFCGDSRGFVTIWSSRTNTISDEIHVDGLNGSVLSSTISKLPNTAEGEKLAGSEVIVFGSEGGEIATLRSVPDSEFWSASRVVRVHSDKVQSISSLGKGSIVSSSMDSFLATFNCKALFEQDRIDWMWPHVGCVGQPSVQLLQSSGMVLLKRHHSIEAWSFSRASPSPVLALRMNLHKLSDVRACSYSTKTETFAVATVNSFHLFKVTTQNSDDTGPQSFRDLRELKVPAGVSMRLKGCIDMLFCGEALVCIGRCRKQIFLYHQDEVQDISPSIPEGTRGTYFCKLAGAERNLMVSDSRGNVLVCSVSDQNPRTFSLSDWNLFSSESRKGQRTLVSAMSFSPSGSKIAVAYTDLGLRVFDFSRLKSSEQKCDGSLNSCASINSSLASVTNSISFSRTERSVLVTGSSFSKVISLPKSSDVTYKHLKESEFHLYEHGTTRKESFVASAILGPAEVIMVSDARPKPSRSTERSVLRKKFGT